MSNTMTTIGAVRVILVLGAAMLIAAPARADRPLGPLGPPPPVVVTGPPPPVAGPPYSERDLEPQEVPDTRKDGAFELSLGVTTFSAALDDVRFGGKGVPRGSSSRVNFAQEGRALGVSSPRFWGGELRAGYLRRYFVIGVSGFVATNGGGADAQPSSVEVASLTNPSKLTAFGGSLNLFGAIPLGRVTLRLGADVGIRSFTMPLSGFEPSTCTSSSRRYGRRSYPCSENASTTVVPYLHPQIRIDIDVGNFFLGPSVGFDALGNTGFMGGFVIGFRNDAHEALRP